MYKHLEFVSTVKMPHEEWLARRKNSIGGSDAAAVVGMNSFASPYSLWAEKTGHTSGFSGNLATEVGTFLEEFIAQKFSAVSGKKVRRFNKIIYNPDYPFAHVNIDRDVLHEASGLECKSTDSLNSKRFKNGEFPDNYYVQCIHSLAITGQTRWYLAVLIGNRDFKVYMMTRIANDPCPDWCESSLYIDDAEIEALMTAEEAFWNLVTMDTPPFADGSNATTEALKEVYAISTEAIADLSSFNSDLRTYARLSAQIKALEKDRDTIANRIKLFMKDAGSGIADGFSISFSSQSRSTFDHKAFSEEHPNMDLTKYFKHSNYRTFKVTERKR